MSLRFKSITTTKRQSTNNNYHDTERESWSSLNNSDEALITIASVTSTGGTARRRRSNCSCLAGGTADRPHQQSQSFLLEEHEQQAVILDLLEEHTHQTRTIGILYVLVCCLVAILSIYYLGGCQDTDRSSILRTMYTLSSGLDSTTTTLDSNSTRVKQPSDIDTTFVPTSTRTLSLHNMLLTWGQRDKCGSRFHKNSDFCDPMDFYVFCCYICYNLYPMVVALFHIFLASIAYFEFIQGFFLLKGDDVSSLKKRNVVGRTGVRFPGILCFVIVDMLVILFAIRMMVMTKDNRHDYTALVQPWTRLLVLAGVSLVTCSSLLYIETHCYKIFVQIKELQHATYKFKSV